MRKSKFPAHLSPHTNHPLILTGSISVTSSPYIPLSEQLANGIIVSPSNSSDDDNSQIVNTISTFNPSMSE